MNDDKTALTLGSAIGVSGEDTSSEEWKGPEVLVSESVGIAVMEKGTSMLRVSICMG